MKEILKKLRIVRRTDLSKYDFQPENYPKIYGFYHVYCVNNWKELVKEQLMSLKDSGLLDRTQSLFVSCNYFEAQDIGDLEKILSENAYNAKIIAKNDQRNKGGGTNSRLSNLSTLSRKRRTSFSTIFTRRACRTAERNSILKKIFYILKNA